VLAATACSSAPRTPFVVRPRRRSGRARVGDDEFAIIQVAYSQSAATEALILCIFKAAAAPSDEGVAIRMSVGVALSGPGQTGDELDERADVDLYSAKADGRNTARILNTHLKEKENLRKRLVKYFKPPFPRATAFGVPAHRRYGLVEDHSIRNPASMAAF
jgi:hypothetical protein